MLTKCQALFAYKEGFRETYACLKKCLSEMLIKDISNVEIERPAYSLRTNAIDNKETTKRRAKGFCIQRNFDEAKKIYDALIEDDIMDMDGYMGYIRVHSENYKIFDNPKIDAAIQIAMDICGEDDLSKFDPDYKKYSEKRKKYFAAIKEEQKRAEIEKYNVGNIVTFGQYWQTHDRSDGKSPIEWIVLRREGDKALLLSKNCLDCKQYHIGYSNATWENCNIRKWLNQKFFNDAFTPSDQGKILDTLVINRDNIEYETYGGNNTTDKIFLLSIEEAENLLNREERQAKCTDYAKAQGAWNDNDASSPYWWLRSPGGDPLLAAAVHYRGKVFIGGLNICVDDTAIRPALWINLGCD